MEVFPPLFTPINLILVDTPLVNPDTSIGDDEEPELLNIPPFIE